MSSYYQSSRRTALVCVSVFALLMAPGGTFAAWLQAQTPAPATTTAGRVATAAEDWPRRYHAPSGAQIVIYEPQVASWEGQRLMTLYSAVAYTPAGGTEARLGTIMVEADTRVAVEQRLVDFSSLRIQQAHFSGASREEAAAATATIKAGLPLNDRALSLDRVLAYLDASSIRPKNVEGVKADPPVVFFSRRPAVVVNIDGAPIWSPIPDNELRFAVNTNWDLFEHPSSAKFFLRHEQLWLTAPAVSGPWTAAAALPASFAKLPANDENWKEVRAAIRPRPAAAAATPTVFVSTKPAEMILLRGEPVYQAVAGTSLLWVKNTESDVFRVGRTGAVYYLVAGRWFSAPGFDGPWTFATPMLPADFAKIPLEHERSRVLASVPGTMQAAEAVLLAQVPQTARVSKSMVTAPEVAYQGTPTFETIAPTTVARATNTEKDIFKVGDLYYMCFQGVWFVASSPSGPWEVTGAVPAQIYEIPISSPSHHVTYVTVEDDDDEWVTYATAAAYTGMMVAWGCAVWGTGYYYAPSVWYGGFYPAYFPHYPTYGYSAWYNPWTGGYGRGAGVYGPYGGAGVAARYNPRTGTYTRGAAAYGPYGARGAATAYNPRTGATAATRQGSSVYGSWGSTGVRRGDQWASTRRVSSNVTGTTTRSTQTSGGESAVTRRGPQGTGFAGSTSGGNVYAGRDGNVYRNEGGSWQKYENGSWSGASQLPADRNRAAAGASSTPQSSTIGQLDRDLGARRSGEQRSRDASTMRSGSSTRSGSGSYRPSGGGMSRPMGASRPVGGGGRRR